MRAGVAPQAAARSRRPAVAVAAVHVAAVHMATAALPLLKLRRPLPKKER